MTTNQVGDVVKHPDLGVSCFLVVATAMTGGGTAHGPGDVFPDGHEITMIEVTIGETGKAYITPDAKIIRRYQTGAFVREVMIPYLVPVAYFPFTKEQR